MEKCEGNTKTKNKLVEATHDLISQFMEDGSQRQLI